MKKLLFILIIFIVSNQVFGQGIHTIKVSGGGTPSNITGLVTQGTNVTITGSGTSGSPYVVNSSGGGGSSFDTTFNSIAILRSYNATSVTNGTYIQLSGYYVPNDGGGGLFVWNSTSTSTDNGGTIIKSTPVTTGRWLRVYDVNINAFHFGAIPNGSRIVTTNLQAALNMTGHIIVPYHPLKFIIDDRLIIKSNTWFDVDKLDTIYESSGNNTVLIRNEIIDSTATGTTDHDITISGGIWDANWIGNPGTTLYSSYSTLQSDKTLSTRGAIGNIGMFGVNTFKILGLTIINPMTNGIQITKGKNFEIGHLSFLRTQNTISDGIHIGGGSYNFRVHDIIGKTGDDGIALIGFDWVVTAPGSAISNGPVSKGIIENIQFDTTKWGVIKMYTGSTSPISDISIKNIKSNSENSGMAIVSASLEPDQYTPAHTTGMGKVKDITFDNISIGTTNAIISGAGSVIYGPVVSLGANAENINFNNIFIDNDYKPYLNKPWLRQEIGTTATNINISNFNQTDSLAWNRIFDFYGKVDKFTLSNSSFYGSATYSGERGYGAVVIELGAIVKNITIANSKFKGVSGAVFQVGGLTDTANVIISHSIFDSCLQPITAGSLMKLQLVANNFRQNSNAILQTVANINVVSSGNYSDGYNRTIDKQSGVIRWNGIDLGIDVGLLTPATYDIAKNINSASAALGTVQYNGTTWGGFGTAISSSANQIIYNNGTIATGSSNLLFNGTKLSVPNNSTASNGLEVGTFGVQSYAINNGWLSDNEYFDGANFKYRSNGFGILNYFAGGDYIIQTAPSSTAGATATNTTRLRVYNTGNVVVGAGADNGDKFQVGGNVNLTTAGNKIKITTGANASIGTATLVAGTVTVSTTAAITASLIYVTVKTPGGTQGFLSVPTITNATSFVINSTSGTETSTVNWWIIN